MATDGAAARNQSEYEHAGRSLNTFTTVLLVGYLAFILLFMVMRRATLSPDVFVVFVSVIAVMLGRGKAFIRDWAPFLLIFLAWEAMRGVAYPFGAAVQSDSIIAIERFIAFGLVPPVALQQWLYEPGRIGPLEISMAAVYAAHFILPLTVAFLLWVKRRAAYYQYVITLMVMSFAQFFTAILMPVAPPRYAGPVRRGSSNRGHRARGHGAHRHQRLGWAYQNINANPVAAFPSLHAAYPILAYLFLREYWPRWSWLMLVYAGVVWFAIMYLGHHYLVDALGGLLYAVAAYFGVKAFTSGAVRTTTRRAIGRGSP